jgi:peptide chain release factor 2
MQELAGLESDVAEFISLNDRAGELAELLELAAAEEGEEELVAEIADDTAALQSQLADMRLRLMMSGRYDGRDALLTVFAGAGGTESQDWAEMLMQMYLRWAANHKLNAEIIDLTEGDEAGIKNATLSIRGKNAFGRLRSERGVHRLVRISPFDNAHRRHTSFALVEVIPDIANEINIEVNPDDIRMDVFHASGHGGQNVQKRLYRGCA